LNENDYTDNVLNPLLNNVVSSRSSSQSGQSQKRQGQTRRCKKAKIDTIDNDQDENPALNPVLEGSDENIAFQFSQSDLQTIMFNDASMEFDFCTNTFEPTIVTTTTTSNNHTVKSEFDYDNVTLFTTEELLWDFPISKK
jgi:hypothetical protein